MHSEHATSIKVGVFVGGSLFILAMLIFFIGQQQRIFYKMDTFTTSFASVDVFAEMESAFWSRIQLPDWILCTQCSSRWSRPCLQMIVQFPGKRP